jgi:hypothetical protein
MPFVLGRFDLVSVLVVVFFGALRSEVVEGCVEVSAGFAGISSFANRGNNSSRVAS